MKRPAALHSEIVCARAGKAGVSFTGDVATGYRANLWLRSAIRVLMLLEETLLEGTRPAGEEVRGGAERAGSALPTCPPHAWYRGFESMLRRAPSTQPAILLPSACRSPATDLSLARSPAPRLLGRCMMRSGM